MLFARINLHEFALAKNFTVINFREITQNSRISRKLLPLKITSFKGVNGNVDTPWLQSVKSTLLLYYHFLNDGFDTAYHSDRGFKGRKTMIFIREDILPNPATI